MKCIVTGHTSGVGKSIYEHFQSKGYEVIGLSRSNGYDISVDQDKIAEISQGCDIFVNNAYSGESQLDLLNKLHDKVKNMIVVGSVAGDYAKIWKEYGANKEHLEERAKKLALNLDNANIFHLKLAFCENASWPPNLESKYKATFTEINECVDFWLKNPKIFSIEFTLKLTDEILEYARKVNPH